MTEGPTTTNRDLEELIGELAEEFSQRLRNGENPDVEEYTRQHPEAADAILQILPALEIMGAISTNRGTDGFSVRIEGSDRALGDFRIVQEIGRGGMGVVYEAEQLSIGCGICRAKQPTRATVTQSNLLHGVLARLWPMRRRRNSRHRSHPYLPLPTPIARRRRSFQLFLKLTPRSTFAA